MDWIMIILFFGIILVFCLYVASKEKNDEEQNEYLYSSFKKLYDSMSYESLIYELYKLREEYDKITIEAHKRYIRDYKEDPIDALGYDKSINYKRAINRSISIQYEVILDILLERGVSADLERKEIEYQLSLVEKNAMKDVSVNNKYNKKETKKRKVIYISDEEYDDEEV